MSVGGTNLAFAKWTAVHRGDDLDTVNFDSLGLGEGILGVEQAEWTCGGDFDAGTNPFDDPPGLYPRDDLANLVFYENVTDNVTFAFPYARVRSASNGAEVRGKVTFEAAGLSQGDYDTPTGSV